MPNGTAKTIPSWVLTVIGFIYKEIRPWLVEQAKKTETPVDDWMITVLDKLLGV